MALSSPEVISMEFSTRDNSHYRIRIGDRVKYIVVAPGTLDSDALLMPLSHLPPLPYDEDSWTTANISRNTATRELVSSLSNRKLAGVQEVWHSRRIDCLMLERVRLLTMNVFECICKDQQPSSTLIAKIARFEWEIPRIELETHAYRLLEGTGIAPRFMGHIHEQGRVIGFLLEKIDGRSVDIDDLSSCEDILARLYKLGLLHGDVNRHNFIIGKDGIRLIDFENCQETQDKNAMDAEIASLPTELEDDSGRGAGFMTDEDED